MRLLYHANGARYKVNGNEWVFRKWVEVPSKDLIGATGIPRKSMYKARDELVKAGYIRFKPGIGSGVTAYMLCLLLEAQKQQPKPTEAYRSLPNRKHHRKGLLIPTTSLRPPCGGASGRTCREWSKTTTPLWSKTTIPCGQKRPLPSPSFLFSIIYRVYRESKPK